jgi:hypothetical protein
VRVLITQPNFVPWLGYLAQMASCDIFISLDSVQYSRREWQNRNRIISRHGKIDHISVSIKKGSQKNSLQETTISDNFSAADLCAKTSNYYRGTTNADAGGEIAHYLYSSHHLPGVSLANANFAQLFDISKLMGLTIAMEKASILEQRLRWESPTERILNICKLVGATTYLSSIGARTYMKKELYKFFEAGIDIQWQQFDHFDYVDDKNFVSHLSCIDYLHHKRLCEMLPYVLSCNKFVSEQDLVKNEIKAQSGY